MDDDGIIARPPLFPEKRVGQRFDKGRGKRL